MTAKTPELCSFCLQPWVLEDVIARRKAVTDARAAEVRAQPGPKPITHRPAGRFADWHVGLDTLKPPEDAA